MKPILIYSISRLITSFVKAKLSGCNLKKAEENQEGLIFFAAALRYFYLLMSMSDSGHYAVSLLTFFE